MNDGAPTSSAETSETAGEYRVLARKYRPQTFDDLIGQEAMVRTLRNAMAMGRLAHAFVLTGVRGVGKTTTARIIAKGLNCIGPDGQGGPTTAPCGVCSNCTAITEDRHVDVLEMDAASRTGVDDIREILDGVRYRPQAARYKVYIVDEVHMLSRNAFNALLKTLEEPPEQVKFIFATTEIRKVPVTVLSRCQRFDLRRIEGETLTGLFGKICEKEGVSADDDALALVARAADGSARDGLSILDQAMALSDDRITADRVRDMLGLADRELVWDLLEHTLSGRVTDALGLVDRMHATGADPVVILQDLLEVVHTVTRFKAAPKAAGGPTASELERTRGADLASRLPTAHLARAWQMMLKGLGEVQSAPIAVSALEMVLIRLAYTADLPSPADLVRQLRDGGAAPATTAQPAPSSSEGPASVARSGATATAAPPTQAPQEVSPPVQATSPRADGEISAKPIDEVPPWLDAPVPDEAPPPAPDLAASVSVETRGVGSFEEIVALLEDRREILLHAEVSQFVRPLACRAGRLEIMLAPGGKDDVPQRLGRWLIEETGQPWEVELIEEPMSAESAAPTMAERKTAQDEATRAEAARDPTVAAVLDSFPGATITAVRPLGGDEDGDPDASPMDAPVEFDEDEDGTGDITDSALSARREG